jgi:hypothetical protein
MSKHVSRKSRWTQLNAREYRAAYGLVRYHAGAWEGTLLYELRGEVGDDELVEPAWQAATCWAGRYKRPRNAMMAVEDKAREVRRVHGDRARIAFRI